MSLLVHPAPAAGDDGSILRVTPESAGWRHVGFEVLALADGTRAVRETGAREACLVAIQGACHVRSEHGEWRDLGGRPDPWSGRADAASPSPPTAKRSTTSGGAATPPRS